MRQGAEANANSYKVKTCIIEQLGEEYTQVVEKMSLDCSPQYFDACQPSNNGIIKYAPLKW